MDAEAYLRERLTQHLPDAERVTLLLPLLTMGARAPADSWRALSEESAQAVALALKDDAERYWRISWDGSLERANQIIAIGEARADLALQALGTMAKGDAIKMDKSRWREAWLLLEQAAQLWLASELPAAEKEIGWARTRIGRVFMAPELEESETAFAEAEQARLILERYGVGKRLISLHLNWARAYDIQMEMRQSLPHYERALALALELGEEGASALPAIYHNMAIALDGLGETGRAIAFLNQSLALVQGSQYAPSARAARELTIGALQRYLGAYGRALRLAYNAERVLAPTHPRQWLAAVRLLMRCHLDLKRYADARRYGEILLAMGGDYKHDLASTHRFLAHAEIGCGNYVEAARHLESARTLFTEAGFVRWAAIVRAEEGWLALEQKEYCRAIANCRETLEERRGERVSAYDIDTMLVLGEALLGLGDLEEASGVAARAARAARQLQRLPSRYRAHLLLGKIAAANGALKTARRRYQAAVAATTRIQRYAGHTLHADLSGSFHGAFHHLTALALEQGRAEEAFAALEALKSRLFLAYLQEKGQLRWTRTSESAPLMDELTALRAEYQQLQRRAEEQQEAQESARGVELEQRIRRRTEQLYLLAGEAQTNLAAPATPIELQAALPPASAMLAYYDDGATLYCFVLEAQQLSVYPLPVPRDDVVAQIERLRENGQTTLRLSLPGEMLASAQAKKARQGYGALGSALLAPVATRLSEWERLYIVPYGVLHSLPFNLLRSQGRYLIEQVEIVTLPSASLLRRATDAPSAPGARWIGYSRNGRLPHAVREVRSLHQQWGGALFVEEQATEEALAGGSGSVLHLSTHGVHRVDHHFDLSYLELADSNIYEDDLLQRDLNYELVTLSACEAGAVKAAPGEELIGLGRAFLYAGAQAVVASLWQVREEVAVGLMDSFYHALFGGASKSAALRQAQLTMLARQPDMHPAFWGAFQLVGSATPLSHGATNG